MRGLAGCSGRATSRESATSPMRMAMSTSSITKSATALLTETVTFTCPWWRAT